MTTPIVLQSGNPTPVVNAATSTTLPVGAVVPFTLSPASGGGPRTISFEAIGAGAVPTTVTAQLQASEDGGVTFQNLGAAINLVSTGAGSIQAIPNLDPGLVYQLTLTAVTLGTATSVTIYGAVS